MITRIAPTPSGYLHRGNCVNFLVTSMLARSLDGTVALRIDDMDADRYRVEYVDDVFRILEWLEIAWDTGPRDTADFTSAFALRDRTEQYRSEVETLRGSSLETYACGCSRSALRSAGARGCVSECRARNVPLEPGRSALRVRVPEGTRVRVGAAEVDLSSAIGDFVVWRRDDLPAYHLASVVEDRRLGTTHVVRGQDLLPSSAAQIYLARGLDASDFASATFLHHPLVLDDSGAKLSKSQLAGGPLLTSGELRSELEEQARRMLDELH